MGPGKGALGEGEAVDGSAALGADVAGGGAKIVAAVGAEEWSVGSCRGRRRCHKPDMVIARRRESRSAAAASSAIALGSGTSWVLSVIVVEAEDQAGGAGDDVGVGVEGLDVGEEGGVAGIVGVVGGGGAAGADDVGGDEEIVLN